MKWWREERGLGLHPMHYSAFLLEVLALQTSALIWTTLVTSDGDWFSYRAWAAFFPSHFPSSLHTSVTEILKTIMLNCKNHSLLEKEIPASITVLLPFWPNGWGSESLLSFWWQTFCRCLEEDWMTHKPNLAPFRDPRQEENCLIWLVKQRAHPDSLVFMAASARKYMQSWTSYLKKYF